MSNSYPMTEENKFINAIETFKRRVDNAARVVWNAGDIDVADIREVALNVVKEATHHKKVGGLNFIKIGRLSASYSIKKKPVVIKPAPIAPAPIAPTLDQLEQAAKMQERMARFIKR